MSNSAFTPTQIEVTNNVPVNVPVVTAWEAYTPTYASGAITGTTLSGFWRRTGDTLETKIRIQGSSASSLSASTTSINYLPTGLTVDSTKLATRPSDRGWTSTGFCFGSFNNSVYNPCILEIENPTTTARILVLKTDNNSPFAATNFVALSSASFASTALNAADRFMEFHLSVPIAEWAGSGTTTLATRAVEEYAWNSSTTTTNDITSFGYGPTGVSFAAMAPTGNTEIEKRVRFQTPVLSTDRVELEFFNGVNWTTAADSAGSYAVNDAGTTSYGQILRAVSGSNTDYSVMFFSRTNGQNTWGSLTNFRWRVRKVSGGAAVGYPVSARNIVGDTSGSVVPTGMLGQYLSETTTANGGTNTVPNVTNTNVRVLTLPAGTWDVSGYCSINNFPTTPVRQILSLVQTSATNGTQAIDRLDYMYPSSLTGSFGTSTPQVRLNLSAPTTLYLVMYSQGASGSVTVDGASIRATRIA